MKKIYLLIFLSLSLQARSWSQYLRMPLLFAAGYCVAPPTVKKALQDHPYLALIGAAGLGVAAEYYMQDGKVDAPLIDVGTTVQYRQLHAKGLVRHGEFLGDYRTLRRVSLDQFEQVLDQFFMVMQQQLNDPKSWFGKTSHLSTLLNVEDSRFLPYTQKLFLNPGTRCICKGDLHGDIHSLSTFLKEYEKRGHHQDGTHLIFHGDYVDRGLWGTEVLYTLMRLKIANPEFVHLLRGNHEDVDLCARYGFKKEFFSKFADEDPAMVQLCYDKIAKLYSFLPVVLYLGAGTEYVQCCHGGIEIGYNPQGLLTSAGQYEWIAECKRATYAAQLPCCLVDGKDLKNFCKDFVPVSPIRPDALGFLWHDFVVDPTGPSCYKPGRGLMANKELTYAVLEAASSPTHKVRGIIRAHQHSPSMRKPLTRLMLSSFGCARLWSESKGQEFTFEDGMVVTLLLSPDSIHGIARNTYPGFSYDTSLQLTLGSTVDQWQGRIWNLVV